jgi:hypothetical protein
MIKKVFNILVITIFLVSTSGIFIARHYCGNSLISFGIFSTPHNCCEDFCEQCHNEFTFNKVTDDFAGSEKIDFNQNKDNHLLQVVFLESITLQMPSILPFSKIDLRKFLFRKTGISPEALGNFRC